MRALGPLAGRADPAQPVSNAIRYTRTGWVELGLVARSPAAVRVEVADTGMPADQLDYIYEEFYRVGVASDTARKG